jgi:hypothetical protein
MKKKVLLFLVLAALIAGGAFAQKVGDSLNAFGKNYTVKEIRDGEVILRLTPTLDGTWKSESSGNVITFNGNNAVFKQFGTDAQVQSAVKKGFVKVGGQAYRNMKKTGDLTWTGQGIGYQSKDDPNDCVGVAWYDITIKLNPDGKTYQHYMGAATVNRYVTYTRQ